MKKNEKNKEPQEEYEQDVFDELEEEGRKGRNTWAGNLVLAVAVCLFLYSGYRLFGIFMEYHKGTSEYNKVQELAVQNKGAGKTDAVQKKYEVDFDALMRINGDTAAWIKFDNPKEINYPVVHCMNNETYLTKTFQASDNKLGAIFIDANNRADFTDYNTILYGHNMNNGSMFAKLLKYKDKDFWSENRYFYIYTPDGAEHKYEIFAAGIIPDDADNYQIGFASDEEFMKFIEMVKKSSAFSTGVEVPQGSRIVTLSTCTNDRDDERYIVHAVEVQE